MARRASRLAVGVSDHAGWAAVVTVGDDARVVDRRRVELVERGVPVMPYHHDAQGLPPAEAEALVARVTRSAEVSAAAALDALAGVAPRLGAIALRACPPLPPTVMARITDYRAQCVADWVMYRQALAGAARARGWSVHWYDARRVVAEAARALGRDSVDDLLAAAGAALGPPWQKDQRLAMAAAIAARFS